MFFIRTSLRPSPIHGIGVFAEEPVRQGQLVWQFDPRVDLRIPVSELSAFPPAVQEHIRVHAYVEMDAGRKVMILCADHAQYVNHASPPNLSDSPDGTTETAARDIALGEELTCDYYGFDLSAGEKLGTDPGKG
jgi:hypothetical protein